MSHPKGDTCYEISPDKTVRAAFAQGYEIGYEIGYAHGKDEASPVSPAGGEAGIQRYTISGFESGLVESVDGNLVDYEDHRTHVARLTAENARLRAEVRSLQALVNQDLRQLERMQSELANVRELSPSNWTDRQVLDFLGVALRNVDLVGEVRLSEIRQGFQYMQDHQSAPAAKGEGDE